MPETDSKEIWKGVVGYEGLYMVSDKGRVKSMARRVKVRTSNAYDPYHLRTYYEKIRKLTKSLGYDNVVLSKGGVKKRHQVHQLVAKAFIPNPDDKPFVHHKNAVRDDNRAENLKWVQQSENLSEAVKNGKMAYGKPCENWEPLTERQVKKIRELRNEFLFPYQFIADQMRLSKNRVMNVCLGKTYKYY